MIVIDYKDKRPLYEQIYAKFRNLIILNVLEKDVQLPSVRNLAMELSINPNTIQKAYALLEQNGFIYSVKGVGNFVRGDIELEEYKFKDLSKKADEIAALAQKYEVSRERVLEIVSRALKKIDLEVKEGL